jgi:hypothetical protein
MLPGACYPVWSIAAVAQLVERVICNLEVAGSSPAGGFSMAVTGLSGPWNWNVVASGHLLAVDSPFSISSLMDWRTGPRRVTQVAKGGRL